MTVDFRYFTNDPFKQSNPPATLSRLWYALFNLAASPRTFSPANEHVSWTAPAGTRQMIGLVSTGVAIRIQPSSRSNTLPGLSPERLLHRASQQDI